MSHRVNITLSSKEFHAEAVKFARSVHHTDFSGMVSSLIVAGMRREAASKSSADIPPQKTKPATKREPAPSPKAQTNLPLTVEVIPHTLHFLNPSKKPSQRKRKSPPIPQSTH